MRDAVAADMATEDPAEVKTESARWLADSDLAVYASEFGRNTFQGGLNWYGVATDPTNKRDIEVFAGKKIYVPSLYIAGRKDWGTYQEPGAVENLGDVCPFAGPMAPVSRLPNLSRVQDIGCIRSSLRRS